MLPPAIFIALFWVKMFNNMNSAKCNLWKQLTLLIKAFIIVFNISRLFTHQIFINLVIRIRTKKVDDATMERLASNMADDYCKQLFRDH